MNKKHLKEDFTTGFCYSVKNGEMCLSFFCDCCGTEVKVIRDLKENQKTNKNEMFSNLKEEMDGKFHRCVKCNLLVCQDCYQSKDTKCVNCPLCLEIIK